MANEQWVLTGSKGKVRVEKKEMIALDERCVRVKVSHSGISPGTELLGLSGAWGDGEFRMGYQAAGVVEQVGAALSDRFHAGQRVACYGGPYVYHASRIDVPHHLCTPLPDNVENHHAAFCALASIALHGFRHSECHLGETVAVVGLGLLGNLAAQCAQAAGCRVVSSELLPKRVNAAREAGLEVVADLDALKAKVDKLTATHGADAVILAVKNTDDALLKSAFEMVRRLGKVVILGLSDARVPRELMFAKEASIVVSRAAGWGRYLQDYELDGRDMPYEHARWTEGRNLEEAIRLMSIGAIKMGPLITDMLPYEDCEKAYEMLQQNPAEHLAVGFEWTKS